MLVPRRVLFQASLFIRPKSVDTLELQYRWLKWLRGKEQPAFRGLFLVPFLLICLLSCAKNNMQNRMTCWCKCLQFLFLSGCLYRRKSAIFFQRGQCSRPYLICSLISSVNYDNKMITRLPWPNKRPKATPFPFTTSCSGVFGFWGPLESTQPAPYGWYTTRQPNESEIAGNLLLRTTFCHTLLAVEIFWDDSRYHKNPHPALRMFPHLYHPCMVCISILTYIDLYLVGVSSCEIATIWQCQVTIYLGNKFWLKKET